MDPEQNIAQPPSSASGSNAGLPPSSGQDSELYNQIAGQDADPQVVKKKNKSLLMSVMVGIMRIMLWWDSVKRTHEVLFRALGSVWAVFMGILYLSGILILLFALYNRLQLPVYLEDELHARNIEFESAEYGMDRIVVRNLKDKDGSYTVDTMIVYSTFTDLLQRRIRSVTIDGLDVLIDTDKDVNVMEDVPRLLSRIQNPKRGRLNLKINSLTVNKAQLVLKDSQFAIPVSFNMESVYADQAQIVMYLSVDQPALKADGNLVITDSGANPEWQLTIKGTLTLPRSSPEDLSGTLKMTLNKNTLETIAADFKLGYGTIEKHITANLTQKEDKNMTGQIVWEKNNLTEKDLSSYLSFGVPNLTISSMHQFHIFGPLSISARQFNLPDLRVMGLNTTADVDIVCDDLFYCSIDLKNEAVVSVQDLWAQYQHQSFHSKEAFQFSVLPQEGLLAINEETSHVRFHIPLKDIDFVGKEENMQQDVTLLADTATFWGTLLDDITDTASLSIDMQGLSYNTPVVSFKNSTLKVGNFMQDSSDVQMTAYDVQVQNLPPLSYPFDLKMNRVGNQTSAFLNFKDTPVSARLEGQLSLGQRTFVGKIYVPPFELKEMPVPVQSLWPGIASSMTDFSGLVAITGGISWLGPYNVSGPITVGLKDVSFSDKGIAVEGLNTVLTLDTLQPMATKQNQHLYIRNVTTLLPFQDVDMLFQMDAQNLRLNQFSTMVAGIPLTLPPSVIATKNANMLIYLKNEQPIEADLFNKAVHLANLSVGAGTANLSVPLEIQNSVLSIPNASLKLQNVLLQRTSNDYGKVFGNSDNYFVRNGQVILDANKVVQIVFNGRLLPSKMTKDVQLNDIQLPASVLQSVPSKGIPGDIEKRLNLLFAN